MGSLLVRYSLTLDGPNVPGLLFLIMIHCVKEIKQRM